MAPSLDVGFMFINSPSGWNVHVPPRSPHWAVVVILPCEQRRENLSHMTDTFPAEGLLWLAVSSLGTLSKCPSGSWFLVNLSTHLGFLLLSKCPNPIPRLCLLFPRSGRLRCTFYRKLWMLHSLFTSELLAMRSMLMNQQHILNEVSLNRHTYENYYVATHKVAKKIYVYRFEGPNAEFTLEQWFGFHKFIE